MVTVLDEWGALSAGQEAAVRNARDGHDAKKAVWAAADAKSEHLGTVAGGPQTFTGPFSARPAHPHAR